MLVFGKAILFAIFAVIFFNLFAAEKDGDSQFFKNKKVESNCSGIDPGSRIAVFSWAVSSATIKSINIDLTEYYNGWATEKFKTIAKLEGDVKRFEWKGGDPGGEYLWRLRAYVDGKWHNSETLSYQVPVCPVDFVERDKKPTVHKNQENQEPKQ